MINLLNSLNNLAVDRSIADRAGRLIYDYARRGFQISFSDTLVTTNAQHFPMLEGRMQTPFLSQG